MIRLTSKEKKRTLFFYLPFYFLFSRFILSLAFGLVIELGGLDRYSPSINPWFNVFYDIILTIVGIIIYRHFFIESFKQCRGRFLKIVLWSFTVGFIILYATNIISGMFISLISPQTSTNQSMIIEMSKIAPFQMLFSSVVLAPILEEMVFRVGIFSFLYEKNVKIAYFVSSVAFGMVHIISGLLTGDLSQLLFLFPYSLLGSVFCYLYEKQESVFAPMLVHAANNFVSMMTILFL